MRLKALSWFICLFALSGTQAFAEQQFWVSVGSYKTAENAERAMTSARDMMSESFAVLGVDTPNGYFYRVAAGPFLTRDIAESRVQSAQSLGFNGAWMWAGQSETFSSNTVSTSSSAISTSSYEDDLPALDAEYNFDDTDELYRELDTTGESYDAESETEAGKVPELIEEAPDGYRLNKLRRDASFNTQDAGESLIADSGSDPPLETGTPPGQLLIDVGNPIPLARFNESDIKITIDGQLDEAQWAQIPGVDSFTVVDPDTGVTPEFQTIVKMFYTEKGLYASFEMEQPPATLVTWYSGRDQGRLNRDNVGITLDTSGEGRYGYWVNLALGGNQTDGTVLPERQFSGDWDGAWLGGTAPTESGWNAEIFLPWSQMAMPKQSGERVLNAYASRKVAYLDERWAVPALPFTQPLFMSALQPLTLNDVDPRQQWSIFPYASVTMDEVEGFTQSKFGTDVFWRPSTNFQLTATLNPDFGNVESDDVIVNLSAFETFFPEKRLFFKEGTEVFDTTPRASGRNGEPLTVLNTRRIGGSAKAPDVPDTVEIPDRELGQPIELIAAVKAVGQVGKVRYGLLSASEDEAKFDGDDGLHYYQDGSDYGVARFLFEDKGSDGSYRAIGTISTLAQHTSGDATVHGVDYHYLSAGGGVKVDGQLLHSDLDEEGTGSGGYVDVRFNPRQGLEYGVGITHFDDTIDINELGFQRRNDMTNVRTFMEYNRSDLSWVRNARVNGFAEYEENGAGEKTRKGFGTRLRFNLNNRDELRFGLAYFPARDEDRDSRGNGTFEIDGRSALSAQYSTDTSKRLSYEVGLNHDQEVLGGELVQGRLGVVWRPIDQINVGASAEYRKRDGWLLWQGDRDFATFQTREWRPRLNLDYFLTAKQQVRLSAQWVGIKALERDFYLVPDMPGELIEVPRPTPESADFAISRVNVQLRYRWEIAPLSELFLVYTLNGQQSTTPMSFTDLFQDAYDEPVGEQFVMKLRYRLGS